MNQSSKPRPDPKHQKTPLLALLALEPLPTYPRPELHTTSPSNRDLAEHQASDDQQPRGQGVANKPQISLVNAAAFLCACKSDGTTSFQVTPCSMIAAGYAAQIGEMVPEVPGLPKDYQEYKDVFSAQKAKSLPRHRPYDLAIQIEPDRTPPLGPIYLLSTLELQTLQEFLEENTKTGIICPSKSSCGAPVLFVKKKDGTLRLCIDY